MPNIPNTINGVAVEFSPNVDKNVNQRVVDALTAVIKPNVATGHLLTKIYISSANDQHAVPSRHVTGGGSAVDISRINDMKIVLFYSSNHSVKAIVDAMQTQFESYSHRRENFGPFLKKKLGKDHAVPGHGDHIHFSVN